MNKFDPISGKVYLNDPISIAQADLVATSDFKTYFYGGQTATKMTVSMEFTSKAEDCISNVISSVKKNNVPTSGGYEFPSLRLKGDPYQPKEGITPGHTNSGITASPGQVRDSPKKEELNKKFKAMTISDEKKEAYETPKKRKRTKKYKTPQPSKDQGFSPLASDSSPSPLKQPEMSPSRTVTEREGSPEQIVQTEFRNSCSDFGVYVEAILANTRKSKKLTRTKMVLRSDQNVSATPKNQFLKLQSRGPAHSLFNSSTCYEVLYAILVDGLKVQKGKNPNRKFAMAIVGKGDEMGNPNVQCSLCKTYVKFKNSGKHKAINCAEAPYTFPRYKGLYPCFMGCNEAFKDRLFLMEHLVTGNHRENQGALAKWGYDFGILEEQYNNLEFMRTRTQRDYVNRKAQIGKRVREEAIQIVKRQREAALETRIEEKAQRKAEAMHQRMLRKQKKR